MRRYWHSATRGKSGSLAGWLRFAGSRDEFVNELTAAGVVFRYYDPALAFLVCAPMCFAGCIAKLCDRRAYRLYWRAELLRRAYVRYGPEAKQDYAVRLEGPIVEIFSSLSWKTCQDKARRDAGGTSS